VTAAHPKVHLDQSDPFEKYEQVCAQMFDHSFLFVAIVVSLLLILADNTEKGWSSTPAPNVESTSHATTH
jgi:hypothetical protein